MVPKADAEPVGRFGAVIPRDLPPTPEQLKLREIIDNMGRQSVKQEVTLEDAETESN